ncbi:hemicentin-1-like isoform X1 [Haliotis rufescens]|uniref:hemicentin-1-like isoform X1 n=1 Tax=Haliotis rufescens TaxID=6454 RepID=UPI00201EBC56|nr:hemicentin-1-like isoform X1 [Haliotis rufescens]
MVNWLACVIVCNVLIGRIHQTRGCGGTYRGQSGTITSPNYHYTYANYLSCTYVITPSKLIGLKFEKFNTEFNYDYVKVYDVSNKLLVSLSGSHNGYTVPSSTYYRVEFTTDRSIGSSGFRAVWRSAPTISGLPSTYRVNKSSRLRLDCSSYTRSATTPTYRWTNRWLTVSTGAVLDIVNINKNQAGQYTCTATNTVGADSATVNVVVQYSPEISGLPSTYQVNESTTLRLDCSSYTTHGYPSATTYNWSHGGSSVSIGAVLTRSSISRSQRGEYTCTASNTVGSDIASVNVTILYSPAISGLPSTYQVTESATLRLDCSSYTTHGYPSATTYSWSHGGSTVSRRAVLTRSSISRSQGGAYTCTARNTVGSDSASVNVDVRYSPEISGLPSTYQVNESATLRLDCSSYTRQGNPQAATYSWSHGGSSVGRGAVLTRSSISRSQGGAYTCTVRNTVGSDSASVNVTILYSPAISGLPSTYQVTESATLRLDCSSYTTHGYPSATTYSWSHGGSTVSRRAVLTRSSISRSQGGAYTCTARNTVGSDSASVIVDVRYSPEISGLPSTYQVTESATLRLDCSSYTTQGNPSATSYTWSHGGSTVGRGAVLTRSSISRSQGGAYTCTVRNTVGSDSASVNVTILYSPEISGLPSTYQVIESATLRLDCSSYTTQGNPQAATYSWSHGGSSVGRRAVLTRSSISRSQGGAYTCIVRNTVGSDSASVNVTILYSPAISGLPSTYQVTESATLTLDCSSYTTHGYPSATTYSWSHGGSSVGRGAVLTRISISRSQGGEYTCTASNTVGSDIASVNVTILYSPAISGLPSTYQVTESATLRLDCSSHTTNGNPSATTYSWSHGGSTVSRGAVLTRSSISRSRGGAYTCTARNTVGSDSASVNVDIRYSPDISGLPSTYQVTESATLRLDCSSYTTHGNPSATTYSWSRGGSSVGRRAVLTRSSISRSQGGAYTCTVRNTVGSDSASVNVTILYSPDISGLPSTYQVTESTTLRLDCSSHTTNGNPSATTYSWSHGGSSVGRRAVLTRSSISRSQGGAYTCTARNTVGSESASVNVDVRYSPEISGLPSTYQVTESATLRLDCSSYTTQGNPSATSYTWSHGGSTVGRGAVLTRSSISRSQGGAYTCTVRNTVGSDSASVNVTILYSPEISGLPSTYQVNESATLRLDCSSYTRQGNPQAATYSWSHGGSSVGRGAVLTRSSISRSQGGAYTCTVRNTVGSDSASVNVTILYSPEISGLPSTYQVNESATLRLDCSSYTRQGNPQAATYSWSHGGSSVGRGAVLTRSSISRSQGGAYTCTVRNTVGSDSASVNVTILYSPEISGLPSTFQVTESATLRLDCSSYTTHGNPSATTYSWSHGGSSVGRRAVLTRSSISRSQGGAYTCTVRNTVGSDSASVNVTILYSPAISGLPSTYQVTESATLRLDCSSYTTHGYPSATTYSWSHGGSTVSRRAVLTRSSISRSQGGAYTCTARNTVGSDSASVNVDVRYSPEISGLPSTYQVNESATLRLDCSSYTRQGNPQAATYSWSHGGSSVGRGAVLTRSSISRSQGGAYTCTVRNTVGSDSASVNVTILYSPEISGLPSTFQVTESATLRLDCSSYTTHGNPSATTYSWSHGGSSVGRRAVLTRSSISRSQGGAYTCTVRNTVGSDSASVNVTILFVGGEEPTNLPMNSFMPRPSPFEHDSVDVNTKSCDVTKQSCED